MDKEKKKKVRQTEEHTDEAMRLFEMSDEVHQAEERGLIGVEESTDIRTNLNEQAIDEAEKAIKLQNELSDDQESE